jgi:hypothetical protein
MPNNSMIPTEILGRLFKFRKKNVEEEKIETKSRHTCGMTFFSFVTFAIFSGFIYADDTSDRRCIEKAAQKTSLIKMLPRLQYLETLDGDRVSFKNFYLQCRNLFPFCCIFEKFYYWDREINEIQSKGMAGLVTHKIRSYHNTLSVMCPQKRDKEAIYGDVAEFYNEDGRFMGIVVYMGQGTYCSLPYIGYRK